MNLPMVAIILEEHQLSKIHGASKTVHMVNSNIEDIEKHITVDMTGRQINAIYKKLDYKEQLLLVELDIYDEMETNIVVNQIELLNSATDTEGRLSESLRQLVVVFLATLILLTGLVVTAGYYENSKQHEAVIESKMFSFIGTFIDKVTE